MDKLWGNIDLWTFLNFPFCLFQRYAMEHMLQDHLVSISPTFYQPLLPEQIPNSKKDTDDFTVFLHFWDLCE